MVVWKPTYKKWWLDFQGIIWQSNLIGWPAFWEIYILGGGVDPKNPATSHFDSNFFIESSKISWRNAQQPPARLIQIQWIFVFEL